MLNVVLVEPEIPPNCGNIARTCAATGSRLHLVEPLGFDVSDKAVKRAGLDYWHLVEVAVYSSLDDLFRRRPEAGAVFPRQLAVFRQGDKGPTPGFPGAVPGPVHPPSHGQSGPQPQPCQQRRRPDLRGPAAKRIPRSAGNRGNAGRRGITGRHCAYIIIKYPIQIILKGVF